MILEEKDVICLESAALRKLITSVVEELKKAQSAPLQLEWIAEPEVMALLNISSKTTLQKFRNDGLIRFSKTTSKSLLYYRPSILDYIEKNAQETF